MEHPAQIPSIRTGGRFRNPERQSHGAAGVLKWIFNRKRVGWPKWIDSFPGPAPASCVTGGEARVTFINHSTLLIQLDGANILTDPIWSDRAGPFSFLGAKRVRAPGLRFEELPHIDAVLLSHNHYDHMDIRTLKALDKKSSPLFLAGLGNRELLEKEGLGRVEELDWWEKTSLSNNKSVFFVPAQHFSGRTPWNIDKTLWGGFMVESSCGHVYFAGDTGFGQFFEQLHENFPDINIALLPVGAYEPRWFMSPVHMDPADAVHAHQILKPALSIGIHTGTFHLADEGIDAPAEQLEKSLREEGVDRGEFIILEPGEMIALTGA